MDTIIIINSSNFPFGYASVEKIKLLTKGLNNQNWKTYVLNMFSNLAEKEYSQLKPIGKYEKTIYIYIHPSSLSKLKKHQN